MIAWEGRILQLLRAADGRIRVLGTCTADNLAEELAALERAFASGSPRPPRFSYRPRSFSAERPALEACATWLDGVRSPVAALYADRARELALEAQLCEVVGTPELPRLARARFSSSDEADHLARQWSTRTATPLPTPHRSDDEADGYSLISRLRQEVGRLRLPVRVESKKGMAALAATGRRTILVKCGAQMSRHAVERTVLHEIQGHALPRSRAVRLFAVGTARGSDDQEGRAIALEAAADMLDDARRIELARRHLAAVAMRSGANFVDTVRCVIELGASTADALRIAARVQRGGGLGRELTYLTSFLAYQEASPAARNTMALGRVSIEAANVLCGMSARGQPYHDEMVTNPVHV